MTVFENEEVSWKTKSKQAAYPIVYPVFLLEMKKNRGIFESIIEKIIVGGYDEDGNKDPYKITFIYKTGFKNEIGNAKGRFDKSKRMGDKTNEMCSHIIDEVKNVCSFSSDDEGRYRSSRPRK